MPDKNTGMHTHRLAENPEEERFANAWRQYNQTTLLEWLLTPSALHERRWPAPISERDEVVAATIVQWLGAPVGQGFLRDLGYVRVKKSRIDAIPIEVDDE